MSFFGQNNNQQNTGFGGFGTSNTSSTEIVFARPSTHTATKVLASRAMLVSAQIQEILEVRSSVAAIPIPPLVVSAVRNSSDYHPKPSYILLLSSKTLWRHSHNTKGFHLCSLSNSARLLNGFVGHCSNTRFNPGFGATNSTATPFGGNTNSGFGSNTSSGGSLFGNNTATAGTSTGFGGFGSSNTNTSGGLFGGGNKPAFGSQPTTSGSIFGGGSNAFGSSNNQSTTGFGGAPLSSALASNTTECQGTGNTPFSAYSEKEGTTGNHTNHFQSITFMPPYKNFSFEELRLADYNQGRRYGNGSGQAGAFGASTGFGGFSGQNTGGGFGNANQSPGLFGAQTSSAAPFGGSQTATSGFGSNNTSGNTMFGGNATSKPGGIFGSTTSQPAGSGFFGSANQSGGFGSQNNANTGFGSNQSGGLFGNNNQQKPGLSFGQNNNTASGFGTSGNTGFGTNSTANTGSGLFGASSTSTPFGGGQTQQSSNLFGGFGNTAQNQSQPQSNTGSGFGGFGGNDQQKSGGLFGTNNTTSNTGSGLFGNANQNNQQPSTGGGIFGTANNNQSGGSSLFGPKPAATGTGLFGSTNTSNTGNTGGGLFGNAGNQGQQSQPSGLFGNTNNQQQQKPGGLFGGNTGGGIFGNSNNNGSNQQQGSTSSLFGGLGSNSQQQQPGGLFGSNTNNNTSSIFGNSQQQPQPQQANNPLQAPQAYNASIFDANPYGSRSIFDGLPPPPQQYTGPVATPIGQKEKSKKGAVLPQYRINPHVASRFVTPQKRQGYGFTYSTYGTPSSVSSNMSTPGGMSSSLLAGSISRGLGKSLSTSNLRRSFDPDQESLLAPGAFSASTTRYGGTGSLKKLTIDRSLRTDLFKSPPALPSSERNDQSRQPSILKKKVSFDASTVGGNGDGQNGTVANGLNGSNVNHHDSSNPQDSEQGSSSTKSNGLSKDSQANGALAEPEMEQVRGNELAVINEDGNHEAQPAPQSDKPPSIPERDPQPGNYYMDPSYEEVAKMLPEQKRQLSGFRIGRENCGYVTFDRPVNLLDVPMDRIFGEIAQIELRSVTIYPNAQHKPPRGKGLNVPSTIYLANSWPRNRFEKDGPRFQKHVQRLERVHGTDFVRYEKDTGVWVFRVKHFSTYALDYDDDDGSGGNSFESSTLSTVPESPTPQSRVQRAGSTPMPMMSLQDSSMLSSDLSVDSSGPDDTFEFRRKRLLPGTFDDAAFPDEEEEQVATAAKANGNDHSFLDQRSATSKSDDGEPTEYTKMDYRNDSPEIGIPEEQFGMAGSFPQLDGGPEQVAKGSQLIFDGAQTISGLGTPNKLEFNKNGDWAEELRRTISPRKQDRHALRESQARVMKNSKTGNDTTPKARPTPRAVQPGFATTMDLMHSIFPKEQGRREKGSTRRTGHGAAFQYPYPKTLSANDDRQMSDDDRRWHESFKPSWGPGSVFLYAASGSKGFPMKPTTETHDILQDSKTTLVSEGRDVHLAKFANTPRVRMPLGKGLVAQSSITLTRHLQLTPESLSLQRSRTRITTDQGIPHAIPEPIAPKELASATKPVSREEKSAWDLASILFDELDADAFGNIPTSEHASYEHRVRKDLLRAFWSSVCAESAQKAVTSAASAEERAMGYLSANASVKACQALIEAKDFRLATLVAQLPADHVMAEDMTAQIHEWRELCVLSEMTEPVRALYEICAGNVCICEGKKGPMEDQAKTFVLSQRFGLDWRRAFGLRLWYATKAEEPIEDAVKLFHDDMQSDEPVKTSPPSTMDEDETPREDIHWNLLKLFAASKENATVPAPSLADTLLPHNTVGNPLDSRLSFQLYHALAPLFPNRADTSTADRLARDFAAQLDSQGEWLWSIFILLHLSQPHQREIAILNTLARHAACIPDEESTFPFSTLVDTFHIPSPWIWEAKALHARSVLVDYPTEIRHLQNAGNWAEAHDTLCRTVGPRCVIERDLDLLGKLLAGFEHGGKGEIDEAWRKGGEVYADYLVLVKAERVGHWDLAATERLLQALVEMGEEEEKRGGKWWGGLEERVAMGEIAGKVVDGLGSELQRQGVLHLPLTGERWRRCEREIRMGRFEGVMRGKVKG
ncbi:MAG: hypothetical protein Q9219_001366 [cf. Caloplaca sp. 3 TL-2023]